MTASDEPGPALPPRIGPYRPLRVLGEGAQGRVYLAEQEHPRREVALKVLRRGAGPDDEHLLRFVREQALRIDHPHVTAPTAWVADDERVRPISVMLETDLPEPDSPTMPSVAPFGKASVASFTAAVTRAPRPRKPPVR